jgi:hypothetical protein|tara:strand:- start:116 stop:310 length:195 start_codon:yes stop_codon:yes gene_type:complete
VRHFFRIIVLALEAYVNYTKGKQRRYLYDLEDKIDKLAADGSPAAKLQLERLSGRLQIERKRNI